MAVGDTAVRKYLMKYGNSLVVQWLGLPRFTAQHPRCFNINEVKKISLEKVGYKMNILYVPVYTHTHLPVISNTDNP